MVNFSPQDRKLLRTLLSSYTIYNTGMYYLYQYINFISDRLKDVSRVDADTDYESCNPINFLEARSLSQITLSVRLCVRRLDNWEPNAPRRTCSLSGDHPALNQILKFRFTFSRAKASTCCSTRSPTGTPRPRSPYINIKIDIKIDNT